MVGQEPGKSTSDQNIDPKDPPRRFLNSRWSQCDAKIPSKSLRRPLSKVDFRPFASPISEIPVKSWFHIGICLQTVCKWVIWATFPIWNSSFGGFSDLRPPPSDKKVIVSDGFFFHKKNVPNLTPNCLRRFLNSRWSQGDAKMPSKSLYRPLSKVDFRPFSSPISEIHVQRWFRIGICLQTVCKWVIWATFPIWNSSFRGFSDLRPPPSDKKDIVSSGFF